MRIESNLTGLRDAVAAWRAEGLRVGFVPTMGNLHAGHVSLIEVARANADRVVASIFVNPTQFGAGEDFGEYPRTPDADAAALEAAGCDLLWHPSVQTMYPFGAEGAVRMRVPGVSEVLEGAHRPGHFDGVATVVCRLFQQVQPDMAVFGRKDYQQLAVIRAMVQDLSMPVEIIDGPTQRDADGLALSSRNQYLSDTERSAAPAIYATLKSMRDALSTSAGRDRVEADAVMQLERAGFSVDYAVVRRPDLSIPEDVELGDALVALIAARIGRTRLIDNLEFVVGAVSKPADDR